MDLVHQYQQVQKHKRQLSRDEQLLQSDIDERSTRQRHKASEIQRLEQNIKDITRQIKAERVE
jgi:hypothetical protein